jgi:hypothetical protein
LVVSQKAFQFLVGGLQGLILLHQLPVLLFEPNRLVGIRLFQCFRTRQEEQGVLVVGVLEVKLEVLFLQLLAALGGPPVDFFL